MKDASKGCSKRCFAYLAVRAVAVQAVISMAVGVPVAVLVVPARAILALLVVPLLGAAGLAVSALFLALRVGAVVVRLLFEAEHRAGLRRGLCYLFPFAFLVLKSSIDNMIDQHNKVIHDSCALDSS
jgi:hypothetical protein